jgi:hypothetical protein
MLQLEFFEDKTEVEMLNDKIDAVQESSDKVRKSLFARHAELAKKYIELHIRMEIIERNICRGGS